MLSWCVGGNLCRDSGGINYSELNGRRHFLLLNWTIMLMSWSWNSACILIWGCTQFWDNTSLSLRVDWMKVLYQRNVWAHSLTTLVFLQSRKFLKYPNESNNGKTSPIPGNYVHRN